MIVVVVVAVVAGPGRRPVVAAVDCPGAPTSSAAEAARWTWIVGLQSAAAAPLSSARRLAAGPYRQLLQHC